MGEKLKKSAPDFANWSCPLPLVGYPAIVMGHGGGGKLAMNWSSTSFCPPSAIRS